MVFLFTYYACKCALLVGNHGSGLANMVWMPEGAAVVELTEAAGPCSLEHCSADGFATLKLAGSAGRSRCGGDDG